MIDSHSAAALVNSAIDSNNGAKFDNDDQFNDIDNEEDEEFIINDTGRRQFIELEEDDDEDRLNHAKPNYIEENESSSSSLSPASANNFDSNKNRNKNRFNYINDTEIETINNAKTNTSLTLDQVIGEPAFKRMRTHSNIQQQQQSQQLHQMHQQIQPQQQQHKLKDLRLLNNQNNINNLFLNDQNGIGLIADETNSILDDQTHLSSINNMNLINTPPLSLSNTQTNSPIISMPASPNLVTKNISINPNDLNSNNNK